MKSRIAVLTAFLAFGAQAYSAAAQPPDTPAEGNAPLELPAISKDCGTQPRASVELAPLPNSRNAIKQRKLIRILAIGAPAVGGGPEAGDDQAKLQEALERAFKDLKVEIVNRGISGELARDAAARLKNEVALNEPDLVVWQVGTADALARIPVDEFEATLVEAIRWLKERNIDVILVGARYSRPLKRDSQYQAIRQSVFKVAAKENVLRISQWQAMEAMERARTATAAPIDEFELGEESSYCVAEYVARAVIATLFAKAPAPPKSP